MTTLVRLTALFALVAGLVLPATVALAQDYPLDTGDLSLVDQEDELLDAGDEVTLSGGGFAPGALVVVTIESDPVKLGESEADAQGDLTATVVIPADLADGQHTLKATGDSASGGTLVLSQQVTVGEDVTRDGELATTGTGVAVLLSLAGLLLIAGAATVVATRRVGSERSA